MRSISREVVHKQADVLVIGGGISGTLAAIKAREAGCENVIQVDKGHVGKSGCSAFAAGVLQQVPFPGDDFKERLLSETAYLQYIVRQDRVIRHFEEIGDLIDQIEGYGVQIIRDKKAKRVKQKGRGRYPMLTFPGPQLMNALAKTARKKGVQQVNKVMITDLIRSGDYIIGAVGFETTHGVFHVFKAKTTIMATGLTYYKSICPGHRNCTGDGYAAAYRAGVALSGGESNDNLGHAFPSKYDVGPGMSLFVGEGGKFINNRGERFMERYYPTRKERAPLNYLTLAFAMEAKRGNTPIYMDIRHFSPRQVDRLRRAIPLVIRGFESVGIVRKGRIAEKIEWGLTAYLGRTGIRVNDQLQSSLAGLYACGEAAAMEAYTAGLAPAASSGGQAGTYAAKQARGMYMPKIPPRLVKELRERTYQPLTRSDGVEPDQVLLSLQEAIMPYDVLKIRHEKRMRKALAKIETLREDQLAILHAYDPHYLRMAHEVRSLTLIAEITLRSAILRKESRLGIREDYPYIDNQKWLKWTEVENDPNGKMATRTEQVPIASYPLQPRQMGRHLHRRWQIAEDMGIISVHKGKIHWR
ncbi:MAG: FAD-binding protein [Deltaproteobacteria bacterium]|nr:FAD-binding protein [Deltaproteobacteria bacterium]